MAAPDFSSGLLTESPTNIKKSYRHCFPKTDISFYFKNRFKLKRHYLEVLKMSSPAPMAVSSPAIPSSPRCTPGFSFYRV